MTVLQFAPLSGLDSHFATPDSLTVTSAADPAANGQSAGLRGRFHRFFSRARRRRSPVRLGVGEAFEP